MRSINTISTHRMLIIVPECKSNISKFGRNHFYSSSSILSNRIHNIILCFKNSHPRDIQVELLIMISMILYYWKTYGPPINVFFLKENDPHMTTLTQSKFKSCRGLRSSIIFILRMEIRWLFPYKLRLLRQIY
jgi:hypothetical protein